MAILLVESALLNVVLAIMELLLMIQEHKFLLHHAQHAIVDVMNVLGETELQTVFHVKQAITSTQVQQL